VSRSALASVFSVHESQASKALQKLSDKRQDTNWTPGDMEFLLKKLGFQEVGSGGTSHRKFSKDGVPYQPNIQAGRDGKLQTYHVKDVRNVVQKYNLKLG
jgi:hypothetical protein